MDLKSSWSWIVYCRGSLVKNDSSLCGGELELERGKRSRRRCSEVQRACVRKLCFCVTKYQYSHGHNSVEVKIGHGCVLML